MTTSGNANDKKQRRPKLPALRSVPAPQRSTGKASSSLTKGVAQKVRGRRNAPQKHDMINPESSEEADLKLPKLPVLSSAPASKRPTRQSRDSFAEKIRQQTGGNGNALLKRELTSCSVPALLKRTGKAKTSLKNNVEQNLVGKEKSLAKLKPKSNSPERVEPNPPNIPTLHSIPARWRRKGQAKDLMNSTDEQKTARKGKALLTSDTANSQESKNVILNLPKLPALRSVPVRKRDNNSASLSKRLSQRKTGSSIVLPQSDKTKQRCLQGGGRNQPKLPSPAQRLKGKAGASLTRKVAKKLFGSGNTLPGADTNSRFSKDGKLSQPKRSAVGSVPMLRRSSRKGSSFLNTNPEQKTAREGSTLPKPLLPSIPVERRSHQQRREVNDENNRVWSPKMSSEEVSGIAKTRGHHASKLNTGDARKSHEKVFTKGRVVKRGKGRGKQNSPKAKKATVKQAPKPQKAGVVRKTRKNVLTSSIASEDENRIGKRTFSNDHRQKRVSPLSSHRGYLQSSDSSDSDSSTESEGSYTSASSTETESKDESFPVGAPREGCVKIDTQQNSRAESWHENATAPLYIKKDVRHQEDRSKLSTQYDFVPQKGIKSRASDSMFYSSSKLTGLKRSSVSDMGKTHDGFCKEEQEDRPAKRQRNARKEVNRKASQSLSYAEQLKAIGQDISGGGCPIREDSTESEEDE